MLDPSHQLSVTRQAKALGISRGSAYYRPRPVSDADLALMRRIDELPMDYPFAGSRMLQGLLLGEGYMVGRLHVRTVMKRMGIEAIYRRPNTSKPEPGHEIYPYLLRRLPVIRPNQVWAMDITYIPMARGFVYLACVVDWFKGPVLSRRLSITLDGKGAWRDNVFVKRLWRTIKYEKIYLHAYSNVPKARAAIGKYLNFYNTKRPHSSLDGQTPDQAYFNALSPIPVAA